VLVNTVKLAVVRQKFGRREHLTVDWQDGRG
jgi:hypothetical protein